MIFKTNTSVSMTAKDILKLCQEGIAWIGEQGYAYGDVYVHQNLLSGDLGATCRGSINEHDISIHANAEGKDFVELFHNLEGVMRSNFTDKGEIIRRKFYEKFAKLIDDAPSEVNPSVAEGLKNIFREIHDPLIEDMRNRFPSPKEKDVVTDEDAV